MDLFKSLFTSKGVMGEEGVAWSIESFNQRWALDGVDGELESIYRKTFSMEISQKALKGDFQFSGSPSF